MSPHETQLTFLLMAHELEMPKDFSILVKITEIELLSLTSSCNVATNSIDNIGFLNASTTDCLNDFTVKFPIDGKFSLVLIHESTDEVIQSSPNFASTWGSRICLS